MRIGVNCYPLQPEIGGLKQYFLTLFRELLDHDTSNDYVFFHYAHNEEALSGLGSERWRKTSVRLGDQMEVLTHLERIDVYFCPLGALFPRPVPRPSVLMLPDIQEVFFPEFFTPQELYMRDLHFLPSTRAADRVVALSEFSQRTLVEHHRLRPEKVRVAHPSVDPRYWAAARIEKAPAEPLPHSFIFYPANLWKHKNHEGLLRTLRILRERGLSIHAVLTGFGQENGFALAQRVAELGVADRVHHLGYRPVEEMAYLYRHARMLVFPSLFEGFGIPLVEAMAVGCPVVAADTTSVPEVVGDAAELFDPASSESMARAIERVWTDPRLRSDMVARGRLRAAYFSPARMAGVHLEIFEEARQAFSYPRYLRDRFVLERYRRVRAGLLLAWRRAGPRVRQF